MDSIRWGVCMDVARIVKSLLICAAGLLIAPYSHLKCEAKQTYISEEIQAVCDLYGAEYDIDKFFLIAVIECESSGNPSAISANGQYIGLMQLNKDTFSGDLFNAENNVKQGAAYLDRLRKTYDVNVLSAYSYFCGECGRWGFYTRKVTNRYFELYAEQVLGKEEKTL